MTGPARLGVIALTDIAAPVAGYYVLRALGMGDASALTCGAALALLPAAATAVRRRHVDAIAAVVFCLFALSLAALAVSGSARVVLAAGCLPTLVIGLAFLGSLAVGRAAAFYLMLPVLTGGQQEQEEFWRTAWRDGPTVRSALRVLTLWWGCLLVGESALQVVLVVLLPVAAMAGLSAVLQVALVATLLGSAAWHGKRTGLGVRPYLDSLRVHADA